MENGLQLGGKWRCPTVTDNQDAVGKHRRATQQYNK
jgi:hypothetical protein